MIYFTYLKYFNLQIILGGNSMNKFVPYCPKCGKELTSYGNELYKCPNHSCNYTLTGDNVIDISFKSKGIAKALSNLCPYDFLINGVKCASMESFIQSLRIKDELLQKEICKKTGPFCYSIRTMFDDWRVTQKVYWKGIEYDRHSLEYTLLLRNAYKNLYTYSNTFKYALNKAKEEKYTLIHSVGCTDKNETLLTPQEYIDLLHSVMQ